MRNKKMKGMAAAILCAILCLGPVRTAWAEEEYGPGVDLRVYEADQGDIYSYEDLEQDLNLLKNRYRGRFTVDSLGQTADGREMYHLLIGRPEAENHVLVFAAIHAREYMTSQLLMRQTGDFLARLTDGTGTYKEIGYDTLLQDTALHIVPMINPDGVSVSQFGLGAVRQPENAERISRIAAADGAADLASYLTQWKANGEGVDINRNFDALWDQYNDHLGRPSSGFYKGEYPGSTKEAAALIHLTDAYHFRRTVSYHAQGNVIYWYFMQTGDLLAENRKFAEEISAVTGYPLDGNYENLDPAGYKDWAILQRQIPSLTIEVGSGGVPLPADQIDGIYDRNRDVLAGTLYTLMPPSAS